MNLTYHYQLLILDINSIPASRALGDRSEPVIDLLKPGVNMRRDRFRGNGGVTPGYCRADDPCGRDRSSTGAEGATAPETLRQTDRRGMPLWKAGRGRNGAAASPKG